MKKLIVFIAKLASIGAVYILVSWLVCTFVTWNVEHRIHDISEWSQLGRLFYLIVIIATAIVLVPLDQNEDEQCEN